EAPEGIRTFLKRITVLLQSPVIIIKTDNGTEFKNQVLKEYFDSVGISHQKSYVRTPQQNGVVERRNRKLVEAARTIKPDISFLYVFGALCYPKNDRKDIGKLGAKGDIGFFIGYSAYSCAYRIYNRMKKKIMETMNVSFDKLSAMAFEQRSSKPRLQSMTSGQISSGLDLTYAPSTITTQQPSEGFIDVDHPSHVYKLKKALYGLKQAPRAWYIQLFYDLMKSRFEMSMMGEMTFFLGLQVNQFSYGIFINQSKYVLEILNKYRMESCDPIGTPMQIKDKLDLDQNGTPVDETKYRSIIGALIRRPATTTADHHLRPTAAAEKVFWQYFSANPEMITRTPIYKIYHPWSPCTPAATLYNDTTMAVGTTMAVAAANTPTAITTPQPPSSPCNATNRHPLPRLPTPQQTQPPPTTAAIPPPQPPQQQQRRLFQPLPPPWRAVDGRMATTAAVEPIKLPISCLYFP
nr:hypothetical protein [Tanacetum cinerariifolium]